jgi:hypothetical protein
MRPVTFFPISTHPCVQVLIKICLGSKCIVVVTGTDSGTQSAWEFCLFLFLCCGLASLVSLSVPHFPHLLKKEPLWGPSMMIHICNSSYSGGGDQEEHSSRPPQATH